MEIFKELGLTEYESRIYASLLQSGQSEAPHISENSGVPKTAVYPNLRALMKKGLVQEIRGPVSLFSPLPPEVALTAFLEEKEQALHALKEKAIKASKTLQMASKTFPEKSKEVMWVSHGKEASRAFYFSSFAQAKKSVYILGWRFEHVDDKYTVLHHLKKLQKRGIDVRILLTGSIEKNTLLVQDYRHEGIAVRYLPIDNFSIFVCDASLCKITLKDKKLQQRFNVHIADLSLAKAMYSYFLECWNKAQELR